MPLILTTSDNLTAAQLAEAFNAGYEGYFTTVNFDAERMQQFITQHDIDLAASRMMRDDNDKIIGLANLGRRDTQGWVGGIGVVPAWRRKGVGRMLMQALIDSAISAGIQELYLEVLTQNTGAYALYQKMGFKTLRRLLIVNFDSLAVETNIADEIAAGDGAMAIQQAPPVRPCWQLSKATLQHRADTLQSIRYQTNNPSNTIEVIYSIRGNNLQIMEILCQPETASLAASLILHLRAQYPDAHLFMVNLPEEHPAWAILQQAGAKEDMSQYEMRLDLA